MNTQKEIRVGIAGYGVVGQRRRTCVDSLPNAKLVAVCDQKFGNARELDKSIKCFTGYEELLAQELDAVIVCMPNDIAPKVTNASLESGRHVFCEKPPGKSSTDVEIARRLEAENPALKLMYGFNHRYHDSVQDALRIVRSGELGRIISLRGIYGKSKIITFNQTDWRTKRAISGGGVLLDQGIHMVDLMRLFAGELQEVSSFISNEFWGYDVEDNAYALMRTSEGIVAMLHSSATQWRHQFRLEINLEKGGLTLSGILSGSKSYGAETLTVLYADVDSDNGDPKEVVTRYNHDPSWDFEIREFISCVIEKRPVVNSSSKDALKTMQLVEQIYKADKDWSRRFNLS
ncbi:MAG: Gfo/Idh/MocA family oxidoreductase [Gammaproteobacteria bacterium]